MITARHADGTFDIELSTGEALLDGTGRLDFTKTWTGEIEGTSRGVMLTGGDPNTGSAGYVALERFDGTVDGLSGSFVLQQIGAMIDGLQDLRYAVAPGSGTGDLAGMTGVVHLAISDEGTHEVALEYDLPN